MSPSRRTQSPSRPGTNVFDNDPFMTHSATRAKSTTRRQQNTQAASKSSTARNCASLCSCCFNEGCVLVMVPWLLFLVIEALFMFFQNKYPTVIWFAPLMAIAFSAVMLAVGLTNRQGLMVVLGTLCLGCSAGALLLGSFGWNAYMRQYLWMGTGLHYTGITASDRAAAVSDASTIHFWNATTSMPSSVVDTSKAIGFVESSLHCVAPIMDMTQAAAADVARVEYWAVGLDCCRRRGAYICDGAGDYDAAYAVVSPHGADPFPGGSDEVFRKAIAEAEAVYNLVSTPQALLVRWLADPEAERSTLRRNGVILFVTSAIAVLIVLGLVSCFADTRGVAARGRGGAHPRDTAAGGRNYRTTV